MWLLDVSMCLPPATDGESDQISVFESLRYVFRYRNDALSLTSLLRMVVGKLSNQQPEAPIYLALLTESFGHVFFSWECSESMYFLKELDPFMK